MTARRTRRIWFAAAPLWAGCAFVFGAPDYSNVGDSAATGDTDVDTDSDTDTDTDPPLDPDAPLITSFVAEPELRGTELRFVIADADGDLIGGEVVASNTAGDEITWAMPQDLVRFESEGESVAAIEAALPDCGRDVDETWTLRVTDRAGRASPAVDAPVHATAVGKLPEGATATDPFEAGEVPPPLFACVSFDGATQNAVRNDQESFTFVPETDGRYRFELDWDLAAADLDLFVYDDRDNLLGQGFTVERPEVVNVTLQAGSTVRVEAQVFAVPDPLDPPYAAWIAVREN